MGYQSLVDLNLCATDTKKMNTVVMLLSLCCLLPSVSGALCLDKKLDPKVVKVVRLKSKAVLSPKNREVVPKGLPEGLYQTRSVEVKATVAGNALVFFTFRETKGGDGFVAPYNFIGKTKVFRPLPLPDLGNNDSRFWDLKIKAWKNCDSPEVEITYDACLACGAGNDLKGRFIFNASDAWSFRADR